MVYWTVSPGFKTRTFVCGVSFFINFKKSSAVPVRVGNVS
jgi:hypothetical protein